MVFQNMRQMPIFTSFTDDQLSSLHEQSQELTLQAGEVLFREGDPPQGLYVILDGEVEIVKRVGAQTVVVANVAAGSFVGEMSLLTGLPHSAMARATTPSRFLRYEAEMFRDIQESPVAQLMLVTMVTRLRDTESQVQQHQKLSALGKMAAGLAHELNNPAAANLSAATHLPVALATMQAQTLKLYAANLTKDQLAFLTDLQARLIERAATSTVDLDPLAMCDLEEGLMNWLDNAEVDESWRIAPVLAAAGVTNGELIHIRQQIGAELLSDTLSWLESILTIGGLARTLKQSAGRIFDLIEAVKAYTYMDQATEQEIDIHDALEATLSVLHHKLNGIEIVRVYGSDLPRIPAYGSELNQVWTILLDNAAYALAEGGSISLRTSQESEYVLVEITDNGPGIPAELQTRLFEPFFTTKPVGQGTGLGLSIARRIIVERHRGMINAESRPGATRFQVFLPTN
ncbi:MAG: ATP-binding protein [Chloroflexota bacterium]